MDIIIRRANESDADAVAELARLGWDPIYDGYRAAITDEIYNEIYKDPVMVKMQKMPNIIRSLVGYRLLSERL